MLAIIASLYFEVSSLFHACDFLAYKQVRRNTKASQLHAFIQQLARYIAIGQVLIVHDVLNVAPGPGPFPASRCCDETLGVGLAG